MKHPQIASHLRFLSCFSSCAQIRAGLRLLLATQWHSRGGFSLDLGQQNRRLSAGETAFFGSPQRPQLPAQCLWTQMDTGDAAPWQSDVSGVSFAGAPSRVNTSGGVDWQQLEWA